MAPTAGNAAGAAAAPPAARKPDWLRNVEEAKRKERSDFKLSDWQSAGFASRRAEEVEAACSRVCGGVVRCDASQLSYEDFGLMEKEKTIVIIRNIPSTWPPRDWSFEGLLSSFGDNRFKVGKADDGSTIKLNLRDFMTYVRNQQDDSPLYVFDSALGGPGVRPQILGSYHVPPYFPDDFMKYIDDRPPYRWVLVGPKRSGTCVHIDPLATNAWNTLLVGRKKWAFMAPSVPRHIAKGRTVLKKGEDDEAVNFFVDMVPRLREQGVDVIEVVQEEGETIFVPGGWWHCVLNITDTVGVTQNYCGRHNFDEVWRSARVERPCMSVKWLANLDAKEPAWAERARHLNTADGFDMKDLLQKNEIRRSQKANRQKTRALHLARRKHWRKVGPSGPPFEEGLWESSYRQSHPCDSDSTVSTTSSESDTSDSESGSTSSSSAPSPHSFPASSASTSGSEGGQPMKE